MPLDPSPLERAPCAVALCLSSRQRWLTPPSFRGQGWLFPSPDQFCVQEALANARQRAQTADDQLSSTALHIKTLPVGADQPWGFTRFTTQEWADFDPLDPDAPRLMLIHLTLIEPGTEEQERRVFSQVRNQLAVGLAALSARGEAIEPIDPYRGGVELGAGAIAQSAAARALERFELGQIALASAGALRSPRL